MTVYNIQQLPREFLLQAVGTQTAVLGKAAGSEKLYVNIDYIQPGHYSAKYHLHTLQEEFFLILSGSGILRMDEDEYAVKKGDFVAKPCGKRPHCFFNSGTEVLEILDVGTVNPGDVCHYPEEGVHLLRDEGKAYGEEGLLESWTSEPNEAGE